MVVFGIQNQYILAFRLLKGGAMEKIIYIKEKMNNIKLQVQKMIEIFHELVLISQDGIVYWVVIW
jgi:hypothetical protein